MPIRDFAIESVNAADYRNAQSADIPDRQAKGINRTLSYLQEGGVEWARRARKQPSAGHVDYGKSSWQEGRRHQRANLANDNGLPVRY
jgi:hypothetical protein